MPIDPWSHPALSDPSAARAAIEALRWLGKPQCPHCVPGLSVVALTVTKAQKYREGLHRCTDCRKQFTVTVGTVLEHSRVPLERWWQAVQILSDESPVVTVEDIRERLGVTYKTAWGMAQTIKDVVACYRGDRNGLGRPMRDYLESIHERKRIKWLGRGSDGTNHLALAYWYRQRKRRKSPLLSPFPKRPDDQALEGLPARTANLMLLLISTDPKSDVFKREQRNAAKRRAPDEKKGGKRRHSAGIGSPDARRMIGFANREARQRDRAERGSPRRRKLNGDGKLLATSEGPAKR